MIQSTPEAVDIPIKKILKHKILPSEFISTPIFNDLIFDNNGSEARDHCANERTFLSYLRLGAQMSATSIAIAISFSFDNPYYHSKKLPTTKFLGVSFWCLSILCLGLGFWTYFKTLAKYSLRRAIVQSSWMTQLILTIIAASISVLCLLPVMDR